jgi:hypothetical protein
MKNPAFLKYVLDPAERAGKTFVEQFVVVLAIGGATLALQVQQHWFLAFDSALWAGLVTLVTTYVGILTGLSNRIPPYADLGRRVLLTFIQSVAGTMIAAGTSSAFHASWSGAIATAIPVTILAGVLAVAAMANPLMIGAGLLPVGTGVPGPAAQPAGFTKYVGPPTIT